MERSSPELQLAKNLAAGAGVRKQPEALRLQEKLFAVMALTLNSRAEEPEEGREGAVGPDEAIFASLQ